MSNPGCAEATGRIIGALIAAVIVVGLLIWGLADSVNRDRAKDFGKAYGSCRYDLEKMGQRWTADHEADDKRRTDMVFLCLSSKGFPEAESVERLHGRHLPSLM